MKTTSKGNKIRNEKVIKTYSILMLGIILFFCLVTLVPFSIETAMLVSLIAVFFFGILVYSKNFFNPFTFFFIFSFLGYIDVTLVAAGVRNSLLAVPEYIYTKTLLIMFLWFLTFSLGYAIFMKLVIRKSSSTSKHENEINSQVIFIMCGAIFGYAIISTINNSIQLGGLIQGMSGGGGAFADQGYLLALLGFAGCLPVMALYKGKKGRAIIYSLLVFVGIIITGRRSMAILTAFVPFFIYWNAKIKRVKLSYLAILALPLIIVILYIGAIRTAENPNFSRTNTDNFYISQLATLARYNGYGDNIPAMIYRMENGEIEYQGTKYVLRGIQYFIPRSLWPDKPRVHSAEIVSNTVFFVGDTGRPVGPYGWAYFNFGIIGVILSGFLTGVIVCIFYKQVQKKKSVILLSMYGLLILPLLEVFQPEAQMKIFLFVGTLKVLEIISRKTNVKSANNFKLRGINNERIL